MLRQRVLYVTLISTLALLFHIDAFAQSVDRGQTIKEIAGLKKRFSEKEKLFLSPSAEDQAAFAEFLKQPDTGLIRLFPAGLYQDTLLTQAGGSLYSFARASHGPGGSDITLAPVPGKYDTPPPISEYRLGVTLGGFIVTIGDVPLDKVTIGHDGLKFLASYNAPTTSPEHRADYQRGLDGFVENGYEHNRHAPVKENYTYAIRSVSYDRSDVLVAFRVVRKETDGSVTLLWKILKRFPTPKYQR
jgi:hypothetical protein